MAKVIHIEDDRFSIEIDCMADDDLFGLVRMLYEACLGMGYAVNHVDETFKEVVRECGVNG